MFDTRPGRTHQPSTKGRYRQESIEVTDQQSFIVVSDDYKEITTIAELFTENQSSMPAMPQPLTEKPTPDPTAP